MGPQILWLTDFRPKEGLLAVYSVYKTLHINFAGKHVYFITHLFRLFREQWSFSSFDRMFVGCRSLRCAHGQCYLAVVRESTENGVEANFRHGTNGTPFESRYFSWLYHNQNSAMAVNRHVRRGVTRILGKLPNMDKVQVAFWRILGWMLRLRWLHFSYYGVLSWISGKKASKWSSKTEKGRRLSHRSAVYLNQSEKVVKIRSVT